MECEICLNIYNAHNFLPLVIFPCGDTVCSSCLRNLNKCPFCRSKIRYYVRNWYIIKNFKTIENNYLKTSNSISNELNNQGLNYLKEKQINKAINCFSEAYIINNDFIDSIANRAYSYFLSNEYRSCIFDSLFYLEKNPLNYHVFFVLASAYNKLGDHLNAYKIYKKIEKEAFYHDCNLYYMIAYTLFLMKKYEKAIIAYDRVLDINPSNELKLEIYEDKCLIFIQLKNYLQCINELENIFKLRKKAEDYLFLVKIYFLDLNSSYKDILESLDKAIRCNNKCVIAYKLKAFIIKNVENNFSKSVKCLKECFNNNPFLRIDCLFEIDESLILLINEFNF